MKNLKGEPTPEGRLAAIARVVMYRVRGRFGHDPDLADFREGMARQMEIELLIARLEEAQLKPRNEARIRELVKEIAHLEMMEKSSK
jgi:hypothetical protein